MKGQINTEQQITGITELILFIGEEETRKEDKHQHILQYPVVHVGGADKSTDPDSDKDNEEELHPSVFCKRYALFRNGNREWHYGWFGMTKITKVSEVENGTLLEEYCSD